MANTPNGATLKAEELEGTNVEVGASSGASIEEHGRPVKVDEDASGGGDVENDEASFLEALQERGAGPMMDETRDSLSLMVKELVKWNVDPEILFYMVGMAPDQTYDIAA